MIETFLSNLRKKSEHRQIQFVAIIKTMKIQKPRAARAFLLGALPLCAIAATISSATAQQQQLHSSITSFDKDGNAIIQETSGDPNRSSVTGFDKNGNAVITYTSPPVVPNKIGVIGAPNPNPGLYNRFGYINTTPYPNGYGNYNYPNYGYGYPGQNYGYPAPVYPPAYPVQNNGYVANFGNGNTLSVIPLTPSYAYPAPYGVPAYPYSAPQYGYPVPSYPYQVPAGYPYGNGYGYNNYGYNNGYGYGNYSSNTTGYGASFGRGGFSASIGGSNTTSRSSTTITVR